MAIQQLFSGTAGKTDYIITAFEFLKPEDVDITVGTDTKTSPNDYTIEGNIIKFTAVPTAGTNNIKAIRSTKISEKAHTYTPGSSITAQQLNDNQDQALFKAEENAANALTETSFAGDKGILNIQSNTNWVFNNDQIDADYLKTDSVSTAKIQQNAVTANEIATNAVGSDELADNAVDINAIQDDAVTYPKLQNIETGNRVLGRASAGQVQEVQVATDMIADDAVKQAKIENEAVNEAKLQISNTPTDKNGYVLTCQSGNTGGLTWAPAPTVGGSILETVSYICDGVSFTQRGKTYNSTAVTEALELSTNQYRNITGSEVVYKPPANTKTVIYEFKFLTARRVGASTQTGMIWHGSLYLDGNEITRSRVTQYAGGGDSTIMKWAFPIGGTTNTPTGRVASWTDDRTIVMKAREYHANYGTQFHETAYWNAQSGGDYDHLSLPMITITAIS